MGAPVSARCHLTFCALTGAKLSSSSSSLKHLKAFADDLDNNCVMLAVAQRNWNYRVDFADLTLGLLAEERTLTSFDSNSRARFVSLRMAPTNSSAAGESGNCVK